MKYKLILAAVLSLAGCATQRNVPKADSSAIQNNDIPQLVQEIPKPIPTNIDEYCFNISNNQKIAIRSVDATPETFLSKNDNVLAAINGPYYDKEDKTEGLAFLVENNHLATEKPEDIRGYFTIDRTGTEIKVTETLDKKLSDYYLVIGTHPLLVVYGEINSQATEKRYNKINAYRSAIGTKDNKNICFAVSDEKISMSEWAERLKQNNYYGALNLDGGPISQLAIKGQSVKGKGKGNTKLVIYSYLK